MNTTEYKFLKQDINNKIPTARKTSAILLGVFQIIFVFAFAFFAKYDDNPLETKVKDEVSHLYPMFMDVHAMMFVGFGFLMTFLKRYGYSSVGFNLLVAAFVLEWALIVRGLVSVAGNFPNGQFTINVQSLLVADFCSAAVLISFGAVLGKASLSQLVVMAFVEVILQSLNEHIGVDILKAVDVGESMYVHVFGAYFGLAVSKVLSLRKKTKSTKEGSNYHSDLFSMIGTVFLWILWPSFNSAVAVGEGQNRAIVNTYLSIAASCITVFIFSVLVGKGRLNMVHVQNATLAGGVAVGAVADMPIQPFGALLIGSVAGIISTLGYEYLTPKLNEFLVHDTCGVNNLHGMPGVLSGLLSSAVAAFISTNTFGVNEKGNSRMYTFYGARGHLNETSSTMVDDRSAGMQGLFQLSALFLTLAIAIVGGILTGILMRLPIFEQVNNEEELFDDQPSWHTPEDYSVKLTQITQDELQLEEKA
jgi:ammonium transporter Rh